MTFAENLRKWNQAKTRKAERSTYRKTIDSISQDFKISERQWNLVFQNAYHVFKKFPDTAQDKKEMELFFRSLPEYPGPLPKSKGETMATFLSLKK